MRPDAASLHGAPCRLCPDAEGRVHVELRGETVLISCSHCGASARAIAASYDLPLSAVLGAVKRGGG